MKKQFLAALLAACLGAMTACSGGAASGSTQAPTSSAPSEAPASSGASSSEVSAAASSEAAPAAAKTDLVKMKIGYGNHLGCALYFIAQEEGYFNDYGLDVELVMLDDSAKGMAAVQAGQLDGGSFGATATFSLIAQGQDLKIFGGQMHEGSGIITLPENAEAYSDFKNYKDKTIGLVRMSTGDVIFRSALIRAGLKLGEDVKVVELDSAASVMEAVKKGEVDAGGSWIPHLKNAEAQGLQIAVLSGEVLANHPCATMVATSEMLEKNPDNYKNLHKALLKAFDLFENDHAKSIADIQKYLELDTAVLESEAYSRYSPNPEINKEACTAFWNMMNEIGYITSDLDISPYLYEDLYQQAITEMVAENPDNAFYKEVAKGGYGANK